MPAPPAARASARTWAAALRASAGELERQRQQAVAGKNRGRLVEGDVYRRLAAAHVVVVHRRQVVVHEAVAVQGLDGEGGGHGAVRCEAEQARAFDRKERAHALAPGQRTGAHGLAQALRRLVEALVEGARESAVETFREACKGLCECGAHCGLACLSCGLVARGNL